VQEQKDFSIILFDIDFFKRINDTYGHKIGDRILQLVANTVQNILPTHTIFARIGGEEFVIALIGYDLESSVHLAENIRQHIEHAKLYYNAVEMGCTVSIGVATRNTPISKIEFLLSKADKKMYAAKIAGRNRVEM
jgi:diguanylate cyclase (GGDEF)-like protein